MEFQVFVVCFTAFLSCLYAGVQADIEQRVNSTYYSYVARTDGQALDFWESIEDQEETYSLGDKTTARAQLKFHFPFYGHPVPNVTVVKNGFLFMGRILHLYLSATEYIAPLMAGFNLTSHSAQVLYKSFDNHFVTQWKDVDLAQQPDAGTFSFQVTLYVNGTIAFIYKQIPIDRTLISEQSHTVKSGLSNAFRIPTTTRTATIFEYDRIDLNNTYIRTNNMVIFSPNTTCNLMETCSACISHSTLCKWCEALRRCSEDGKDWYKQDWDDSNCSQNATQTCPVQIQDPVEHDHGDSNNDTTTTAMEIPTAIANDPVDGTPRPVTSFSSGTTEVIPATIAPGDQLDLEIDSIGSNFVDISWVPAVDSEFPVMYVVQLKTAVTSWFNHTYGVVKINAGRRYTTLRPLLTSTVYNIRMFAYIDLGRTGYTTVIAFQTTSSEDDTSSATRLPFSIFTVLFSIFISKQIKYFV